MADEMEPGFFRRAGARLGDFFGNVGRTLGGAFDTVAGGAAAYDEGFASGMQERTQAEAAMELARQRREETRRMEAERAARSNLGYSLSRALDVPLYDAEPFADIMRSGLASDFRSITGGRGDIQDQGFRSTVADPSLGEEARVAAMEALAPASGVSARLRPPPNGAVEIIQTPEGPRFVWRPDAVGEPPGSRPSSASGGGGAGGGGGVLKASDTNAIYRQSAGLFGGVWDPITGRIAGLSREQAEQVQRIASRASQLYAQGGIDHATAVDIALQEMRSGGIPPPTLGGSFDDTGAVDEYEGITATGPNGEKVMWRNGQWVPVQ